jgi:hypothetical protein
MVAQELSQAIQVGFWGSGKTESHLGSFDLAKMRISTGNRRISTEKFDGLTN